MAQGMESLWEGLVTMMTQALRPEGEPTWLVGVEDVPAWLLEIPDFDVSLDLDGNAYFQFIDEAVIVPKGRVISLTKSGLVNFGHVWAIRPDGPVQDGAMLYIPEKLASEIWDEFDGEDDG